MGRVEFQRTATAHLVADVRLYATQDGGKVQPALPGWGCLCIPSADSPISGYDALLLLGDEPLHAGENRRLGFCFLSPDDATDALLAAERFYLWEGRIIGEARVVETKGE